MNIYNELPTAFPWYDKKEKQQRYRENATQLKEYELPCSNHSLLPFQINVPGVVAKPTKWEIVNLGNGIVQDISLNIPLLRAVTVPGFTYVFYTGVELNFKPSPEVQRYPGLHPGMYYCVLTFAGGITFYSEVFKVFKDLSRFLRFDFWNTGDISPILYKVTGWRQTMYLDTFIHVNEPEVQVEGERDINDEVIPTFQKVTVKSRISVVVPDFIKIALVSAQIHDNVQITTQKGVRIGNPDRITTSSTVESGGAYSTVDVLLENVLMTKTTCEEQMEITNAAPW